MKKFKFSLETVLDYTAQMLDNKKNEYAASLQLVNMQQKKLNDTVENYKQHNSDFRKAEIEGITIAEAMSYETGLRVLETRINTQKKQLREYEKQAEDKRLELVESKKETMKLEKLKEKKLEDYQKQELKAQEQLIDELVNLKSVQQKNETRDSEI